MKDFMTKNAGQLANITMDDKNRVIIHEKYGKATPKKKPDVEKVELRRVPTKTGLPSFVCTHCGHRIALELNLF